MSIGPQKILIVGGGPAGLILSIFLAKKGLDITVVDKKSWPISKVCGQGIMPSGIQILKESGAFDRINKSKMRSFDGISYHNQKGSKAEGSFKSGKGYVIQREELSTSLYETAKTYKNIDLTPNTEISDIKESSDSVTAIFKTGECESYDFIVGCDGFRSKVRELTALEGPSPMDNNRAGARVHYQIKPWNTKVEVHFKKNLELYIAPTSDNCVEFIFGWNTAKVEFSKDKTLLESLFDEFPHIKEKIGKIEKNDFAGSSSFAHAALTPLKDRVALVGDAFLFCDPITGEGMTMAFNEAQVISNNIDIILTKEGQKKVCKEFKKLAKHYIFVTKSAMLLSKYPLLRDFAISLFAKFHSIFDLCLEFNMRGATSNPNPR